uniref:Uncharacterized protein n=1 Tax=Anguilla anguilla TaxID=7936 RepID=A0A0E9R2Q9_ANGAN
MSNNKKKLAYAVFLAYFDKTQEPQNLAISRLCGGDLS